MPSQTVTVGSRVGLHARPAALIAEAVGIDDRQVKADAKRFKEFIESRGTETGAWRGDVPRPDQT